MIEGIRGTGAIEFHNVQEIAFACSRGIGLSLCLLETRVFAHWFAKEQGGEVGVFPLGQKMADSSGSKTAANCCKSTYMFCVGYIRSRLKSFAAFLGCS
jgi:hypothetical protein